MNPDVWLAAWPLAFVLGGLGNTVGYHRLLTHRAFRAGPGVRGGLALVGACFGGPPLLWVGLHRHHHLASDAPEDPHTPRGGGLLHAHAGWLVGRLIGRPVGPVLAAAFALSGFGQQLATLVHDLRRLAGTNPPTWLALCKDLHEDPVLGALERPLATPLLFAGQLGAAWLLGGAWGVAWLWALHLALTNTSWAVNSLCHAPDVGRAPHATGDDSRDVPWLAPFTLGEAYHNTHHRYPRSARHGLDGGFDPSWWAIRGLVALGLARDVWLPKAARRAEERQAEGAAGAGGAPK
jgi:stearoyl-CoA desaturase (delta-9 desaturase)